MKLLVLLLLPICCFGSTINITLNGNETAFWLDVLKYADSHGVKRSSLNHLLSCHNAQHHHFNFTSGSAANSSHGESESHAAHGEGAHDEHGEHHGVHVASFKFDYVKEPLVLTMFIIIIGLFKLMYHHTHYMQKLLPESCCLILVGILLGVVFIGDSTHESVKFLEFNSKTFFFFLLPPIILESAYSLKDRAFLDNLGTIVLYAVVGTVLNIAIIGGCLILFSDWGWMGSFRIGSLDCLIFASLIAAVDPVAVLAIFQEVGVNKMLYFMVFGESLLNDAVTVVCYNLVSEFKEIPNITFEDCFMGVIAFLCVSLGGLFIGLFCGFLSSLITKYTEHVRVVEPVILFGMAYLAYMGSELFHFSGIIGIIACGLFQTHYSCGNVSSKSFISVTYFAKVASSVSESLIFIILGVMLVNEQGWFWTEWQPLFAFYSVVLCFFVRAGVVFFLTYIVNRFTGGVRHISTQEQLIMAYGGLRGAVSFSLAFMISDDVPVKNVLLAATYMVILFTVFVQGSTIKLLVGYLNIRLARKEDNFRLFLEFNRGMIKNMSEGIEVLCGYKDTSYMYQMSAFSKKYVRPIIVKGYSHTEKQKNREGKLLEMDRAATIRETLHASASTSSFKRQQNIEEMAEQGGISREMLEEEEHFIHKKKKETKSDALLEKKTIELTKDIGSIRQLMHNQSDEFYANRNLVGEDKKEITAANRMKELQMKAHGMGKNRKSKRIFGRESRKGITERSLILASMGSLGVHSVEGDAPSTSKAKQVKTPPPRNLNDRRGTSESIDDGLEMRALRKEDELYTINEGPE